ncbi:hypothetical protein ACOJBM_02255 [Rhizobium beringeri]
MIATFGFAGESAVSLLNAGMPADCAEYAANVSHSEGNFSSISPSVNGTRCYGAFQFCDSGTLQQYWTGSRADFWRIPQRKLPPGNNMNKTNGLPAQTEWFNKSGRSTGLLSGDLRDHHRVLYSQGMSVRVQAKKSKLYNLAQSDLDCNAAGTPGWRRHQCLLLSNLGRWLQCRLHHQLE